MLSQHLSQTVAYQIADTYSDDDAIILCSRCGLAMGIDGEFQVYPGISRDSISRFDAEEIVIQNTESLYCNHCENLIAEYEFDSETEDEEDYDTED